MVDLKRMDCIDFMDETDSEEKELQKNSRMTLLSLFCFQIIMENTSPMHPMTQAAIQARLDAYPYSLFAERKAISRTVKTIMNEFPYIVEGNNGLYYDRNAA